MRRIATLVLLILLTLKASGQPDYSFTYPINLGKGPVVDTAQWLLTYEYVTIRDHSKPQEVDRDLVRVEVGSRVIKTYSYNLFVADSLETELQKKRGVAAFESYNDYSLRELMYLYLAGGDTANVVNIWRHIAYGTSPAWKEEVLLPEWKLDSTGATKELLGYHCARATLDFHGRHYTAWYAADIPIPYGPLKFRGLPGLIMEIVDDTNEVQFRLQSFGRAYTGYPIVNWAGPFKVMSRKKARKTIAFMHKHPYMHQGKHATWRKKSDRWSEKTEYKYTLIELK